eukprot:10660256-Alexandrium_andersonii.AAC.1
MRRARGSLGASTLRRAWVAGHVQYRWSKSAMSPPQAGQLSGPWALAAGENVPPHMATSS